MDEGDINSGKRQSSSTRNRVNADQTKRITNSDRELAVIDYDAMATRSQELRSNLQTHETHNQEKGGATYLLVTANALVEIVKIPLQNPLVVSVNDLFTSKRHVTQHKKRAQMQSHQTEAWHS